MDLIDRQMVIDTEGLDEQIRCEMCRNPMHTNRGCDGNCKYDEKLYERIMQILGERIKPLPSAQPESSTDIQDVLGYFDDVLHPLVSPDNWNVYSELYDMISRLPSAQTTLYGYNIEHLALIARLLQKENLPPERVAEALIDLGKVVAIAKDEFEETLRNAMTMWDGRVSDDESGSD